MQVFRLFLFLYKTLTSKLLKPNISGAHQNFQSIRNLRFITYRYMQKFNKSNGVNLFIFIKVLAKMIYMYNYQ